MLIIIWLLTYSKNNHLHNYVVLVTNNKVNKVKLSPFSRGRPEGSFSIATTPRCRGERYSFPRIASLYPWYVPYIADC